jgi:hypothetical protein
MYYAMKKLFVYFLFLISFVSYGQEVTTSSSDSVATVTDTAGSNQNLEALETSGTPITAEDPASDIDTDAPSALDVLNNAVADENIESADADADTDADAPENPDEKEAADPSGPALLLGFGLLPGHESFTDDVISIPLRFSIGADNIFKGFGLMALYERASVLDGKVFIDNDNLERDAYSRLTFGPTFRINKFRIVAGMDLFGPMGFFRSSGAESGVAGSGRKFLGVSYDVFKGLYIGIDASSYASIGVMINYSIPLGSLESE